MVAAAILSVEGTVLTPDERAFLREADPWGGILFARNVESPEQLTRLTGDFRDALGRDALILVDQEGGRVQRLTPPHWRKFRPPLDEVAAAGEKAERVMFLRAALIASELRAVGIDTDCIPCADVAGPHTHHFLQNRCYGYDPHTVAKMARATADGLAAGGCLAVMKHIPGHGAARTDSHLALPRVETPHGELVARDFVPFRRLADLPMAMTSHCLYTAYDAEAPATLSQRVVHAIRAEVGFSGLLMTDDLSMEALSGSLASRAAASRAAGCDLVLYCKGKMDDGAAVIGACGKLEGVSAMRAAAALAARPEPGRIDIAAIEAEFRALTGRSEG